MKYAFNLFTSNYSKISDYQSYFDKNRIRNKVEVSIQHYINKASLALKAAPKSDKDHLQKFATLILKRKF